MHYQKIKECFNKAYATYDDYAVIQKKIGNKLIELLVNTKQSPKNIIDLGCGTGFITNHIASVFNGFEKFYAIDIANQMLEKAKEKLEENIVIKEHSFDEIDFFNEEFDLVFANMSLQWSENLEATIKHIHENLKSGGILAFSLPLLGTFEELRNKLDMLEFNSVLHLLEVSNFQILESSIYHEKLYFPSMFSALQSIKKVGANFCKDRNKSLIIKYDNFSLTYKIGIFIGRKM
ncbi:MAG: hypothetical protein BGO27_03310 [Alphaproteobacteria bacterium 33-17]|nr:MAG: hypothetical protein BGO27_03310 [Alphaproteobacteria bacterium 33-17]